MTQPAIAIVDYGMGNLFSIKNACQYIGLDAVITLSSREIASADGVILPGVGAFGKAMATLEGLKLVGVLKETVATGKPFLGICLGMQLLMSESYEFGHHRGLNIFQGSVVRLDENQPKSFKVPHIGWNAIHPFPGRERAWEVSLLNGLTDGEFMYFVHSYHVRPVDRAICLSLTSYEGVEFCSSLEWKNVFACQFHPEKSALKGLRIYQNWAQKNWGISIPESKKEAYPDVVSKNP